MAVDSTLPPQSAFYHAVLRYLAQRPDGDHRPSIRDGIPDVMRLTDAQRSERLNNMPKHARHIYRSGWALSMLKSAGYVENPARGIWQITERGRELLRQHPDGFDEETGRRIVQEGRRADKLAASEDDGAPEPTEDATLPQSPEERIESALEEIRASVARELLEKICQSPPEFFEVLVLDLLHALGYGTSSGNLQFTANGDGLV